MSRIEQICQILREFGFMPDVAGTYVFCKFEMKSILVDTKEDTVDENGEVHEDRYIRVLFPNFYPLEQDEIMDALVVCNKANRELRLLKTVVTEEMDTVSAAVEFYYSTEQDLRNSLQQALRALSRINSWFYWQMDQMKKNTN